MLVFYPDLAHNNLMNKVNLNKEDRMNLIHPLMYALDVEVHRLTVLPDEELIRLAKKYL